MTAEDFYARFEFSPSMSGSLIGRGGFSSVYKVYDKIRKRYVAVKRSEVGVFANFDLDKEVKVANEVDYHPNIIRYENVERITDRSGVYDYAILKYYAEGNLDRVLSNYKLTETEKRQILKGILQGLSHLHQIPIVHRDLKAANVLMDRDKSGNWIPVIADFGLSRLGVADISYVLNDSLIALTPNYASPEQYSEHEALRPNVDLWAFGVITYKMMIGKMPFRTESATGGKDKPEKVMNLVLKGKLPDDIASIPEPYKTIILKCLVIDSGKRVKRADDLLALLNETDISLPSFQDSIDQETHYIPKKEPVFNHTPQVVLLKNETPSNVQDTFRKTTLWSISLLLILTIGAFLALYWFSSSSLTVDKTPSQNTVGQHKELAKSKELTANSDVVAPIKLSDIKVKVPATTTPVRTVAVANHAEGSLSIFSKYYDMKVYINGKAQQPIVHAGKTVVYKLPAGQKVKLYVEYPDYPVSIEKEIYLRVELGKTLRKNYIEKFD